MTPQPIILTAGRATRCGAHAPDSCKALVNLDGRPVIEWQLDAFSASDPIIVCRSEHVTLLEQYGQTVVNDRCLGAADALASALPMAFGSVTVAYADTFFTSVPLGSDWVGVSTGKGGRKWDVIRNRYVVYEDVAVGDEAEVCVGLYSFSDPQRVHSIIKRLTLRHAVTQPDMGLAPVLNVYSPWHTEHIGSWQDVGTSAAIEAWSPA